MWILDKHQKRNVSTTEIPNKIGDTSFLLGLEIVTILSFVTNISLTINCSLNNAAHQNSRTIACYLQLSQQIQILTYLTLPWYPRRSFLLKFDLIIGVLSGLKDVFINKQQFIQIKADLTRYSHGRAPGLVITKVEDRQ